MTPNDVKDDAVTPDVSVVPDRLAAGKDPAVTVPTVVIEEDPAIGEYVVPAAVVVKYVFVSTESSPVADVFTNPAVGNAPSVIVDVDFPITIGFTPVPAVPRLIVPVVSEAPPILIVPVVVLGNKDCVVPVADAAFITSIVGAVNVAFVPKEVNEDAVETELNKVPVAVGNVKVAAPLVIDDITGAVENVFTPVIDCAVERSCNVIVPEGIVADVTAVVVKVKLFAPEKAIVAAGIVNVPVVVDTVNPLIVFPVSACVDARSTRVTVPEGIVATVVAAEDKPNVRDAAVFVARVEPVINVNVAEVVGAVIVTLFIVEDVVIAPFKAIVAFA